MITVLFRSSIELAQKALDFLRALTLIEAISLRLALPQSSATVFVTSQKSHFRFAELASFPDFAYPASSFLRRVLPALTDLCGVVSMRGQIRSSKECGCSKVASFFHLPHFSSPSRSRLNIVFAFMQACILFSKSAGESF